MRSTSVSTGQGFAWPVLVASTPAVGHGPYLEILRPGSYEAPATSGENAKREGKTHILGQAHIEPHAIAILVRHR